MEIKDKPASMSIREWITKKIATEIMIPESVIKTVISHNYDSAYEAMDDNDIIEISGFGKFYYNSKKADKEIEFCKDQINKYKNKLLLALKTREKEEAENKVEYYTSKLEWLIKKRDNGKS